MILPTQTELPGWPLELVAQRFSAKHHGDYERWANAISALPNDPSARLCVEENNLVRIETQLEDHTLKNTLVQLRPWRKGPFKAGSLDIDTEWRSDWKWSRLAPHIHVKGHRILDIGSGNGYFGWQYLAAGANQVIGIDPTLLFCMQHQAVQHFARNPHNHVIPLGIEEIPTSTQFDTVLSMGVIYHRKDPAEHIRKVRQLTRPGGTVIIESLISPTTGFKPQGRYARMRNVSCIPSTDDLCLWMRAEGLQDVRILDITATTTSEQRTTEWMHFESLQEALDPSDPTRTIEGYVAPVRAILSGRRKA